MKTSLTSFIMVLKETLCVHSNNRLFPLKHAKRPFYERGGQDEHFNSRSCGNNYCDNGVSIKNSACLLQLAADFKRQEGQKTEIIFAPFRLKFASKTFHLENEISKNQASAINTYLHPKERDMSFFSCNIYFCVLFKASVMLVGD